PPEPGRLELVQLLAGLRHSHAHVGTFIGVRGQLAGDIGVVEPAQESSERTADLYAVPVVERRLAELASGQELAAEERPWEPVGRLADEDGHRHRNRQE